MSEKRIERRAGSRMNLPSLSIAIRTLFTGYLLVVGVGILMALVQIMLTHGMADGELGVSVDDIVYSYHGNRNSSKLESKLNGSMKNNASEIDRTLLIQWARDGAPEKEWEKTIQPILEKNCIACHSSMPGLATFASYEESAEIAKVDTGATVDSLTRVSHIHLFGIAFIFIFVGYIFSLAVGFNQNVKAVILAIPFLFILIDISSWWVTSIYPGFAWFTIIGGFGYMMAFAIMWWTSMYQMWISPRNGKVYTTNEWMGRS